ncbi:MAG: glycoside hydrolase family 3 N-terminal domain-containing protein [Candidatus Neomarinimicrobiota bacterium]|nr:glycoside hydrolase family 3 N-terminal domain-containing protein [Candidatus Neomarinimicrobiota bacterium]
MRTSPSWAEYTLNRLTLREKIAQMMIYRMNMSYKDIPIEKWREIMNLIQSDGIGGIHLWAGDGSSSLVVMNKMQELSKIPIIFDADIEKGLKERFPSGTELPPMMAITSTGNPQNAYDAGRIAGLEARAVGIHWNLSPVVDVNNNPENPIINTRSFGEDPDQVSEYAVHYIRGLQDNGVLATAKHFPGHGDTQTDSHSSLAKIPSDSSRLWSLELKPFQTVVNSGVDAVMVSHVHAPDYQPEADDPATLSKFWVTDVLKEKINFNGTIITDGMGMGGITKNYSDEFALIKAVQAGCDIIIQNYDFKGSINAIEKAVLDGRISKQKINRSALKMLKMKQRAGLNINPYVNLTHMLSHIGQEENKETSERIASESITCLKDNNNLLPLKTSSKDTLYIIDIYDEEHKHLLSSVASEIIRSEIPVRTFQVDESDSRMVLNAVLNSIPTNSLILINAFVSPKAWKDRIFLPDDETEFVRNIINRSERIILASLGTPYLLQEFPQVGTYLCAYKGTYLMQVALANALLGKEKISGRLPVSIPGLAARGSGLDLEKVDDPIVKEKAEPGPELIRVLPSSVGADVKMLSELMESAIDDDAWPGGVLLAAKDGQIFYHQGHGYHTYNNKYPVRSSDIFDLASITKVIATTSAVMKLLEQGKLNLDKTVVSYLPEFKGKQSKYVKHKTAITIRHLLTHTSGLPPFKRYYLMDADLGTRLDSVFNTEPINRLRDSTIYSDVGLITLGKLVERISGFSLDELVDSLVFKPLGMNTTFFNPSKEKLHRIIPTEIVEGYRLGLIHGEVHDENAHSLGGVAGHAGLFSTAKDLSIFSQMMLNKGLYGWTRIFQTQTVELFTTKANVVEESSRCLGWDSPLGEASGGVFLSDSSFGHTGFTGTSLWIDPEHKIIVILLTNAVHPNRQMKSPKYFEWRQRIHSGVYEAVGILGQNPNLKWIKRWVIQ